ncbi:uncharacterized protein LOC143037837 [Oratosquilla oratoria]|uniref:uncharacterized protein LOC143037837 n=1 Tax=Oratosquilla oratoria TaxID=337810 RepID=UPI003F758DB6
MHRRLVSERPRDWDRYLSAFLFASRDTPQSSTGYSPFELVYGHRIRGPLTFLKECWTNEGPPIDKEKGDVHRYLLEMGHRLQATCRIAKENLLKAQATSMGGFDRRAHARRLEPEDDVLIFLPDSTHKLTMAGRGPYKVLARQGAYTYQIFLEGSILFHGSSRVCR